MDFWLNEMTGKKLHWCEELHFSICPDLHFQMTEIAIHIFFFYLDSKKFHTADEKTLSRTRLALKKNCWVGMKREK